MRLINFLLLFFLSQSFNACKNEGEQEQEQVNSDSAAGDKESRLKGYSNRFRNLIKTDQGVFRGIEFGMNREDVKAMEDSLKTPDQTENDTLDYIINFNFPETAEVLYYTGKDEKLSRIQVDIYPENIDSQLELFKEFEKYFRSKYGKPVSSEDKNELQWKVSDQGLLIRLRKQGNDKVHDLQIDFTQIPVTSGIPS